MLPVVGTASQVRSIVRTRLASSSYRRVITRSTVMSKRTAMNAIHLGGHHAGLSPYSFCSRGLVGPTTLVPPRFITIMFGSW
jgi:hypothetical protein